MMRLVEYEATQGESMYTLMNLFEDTRIGIFSKKVNSTDIYQRNIQRAYVEKMIDLLNSDDNAVKGSEVPALARWNLKQVLQSFNTGVAPAPRTQMHVLDLKHRINLALEGLDQLRK